MHSSILIKVWSLAGIDNVAADSVAAFLVCNVNLVRFYICGKVGFGWDFNYLQKPSSGWPKKLPVKTNQMKIFLVVLRP